MLVDNFLPIALLASLAAAKPVFLKRQYANSSLPVITQTSTESPSSTISQTAATCTATYTPSQDQNCGQVATSYGIQLHDQEANYASGSTECDSILRGYGICSSQPSAITTSTQTLNATTGSNNTVGNATIGTISSIGAATIAPNDTTITSLDTSTLTYTLGTGTNTDVRTVVVTHTNTEVITSTMVVTLSETDGLNRSTSPVEALPTTSASSSAEPSTAGPGESPSPFPTETPRTLSPTSSSVQTSTSMNSSLTSTSTSTSLHSSLLSSTANSGLSNLSSVAYGSLSADSSSSRTTSTTLFASSCSASATPPAPTQVGIISGCTKWHIAVSGESCHSVAEQSGLDVDTFMSWNPAVNAPSCSNMLIGDAYCVATCENPVVASLSASPSVTSTLSASTTINNAGSSSTPSGANSTSSLDVYVSYTGNGSTEAGWPAENRWVDFDDMFTSNQANMQASCANWAVPDDTDTEIASMKSAIQTVASDSGIDARFILAIVMQESTGCVRVITTAYSVNNPGLMQSHNGNGTCNSNSASLGITGTTSANVQTPCPASEITQMIRDGTQGTSSGDGLQQLYTAQKAAGYTDVSAWYRTARAYNGGSVASNGDLSSGCCTSSYASDVANRLTGWVNAPRNFTGS